MIADAKAATVIWLKDQDISVSVDSRIYYDGEAFQADAPAMAQTSILIIRSGGPEDAGYADTHYERFDFKCYGPTLRESWAVYGELQSLLKNFTPRDITTPEGEVRVYNFVRSGGPNELRDPDGGWPFVWSSWIVKSNVFLGVIVNGGFSLGFSNGFDNG